MENTDTGSTYKVELQSNTGSSRYFVHATPEFKYEDGSSYGPSIMILNKGKKMWEIRCTTIFSREVAYTSLLRDKYCPLWCTRMPRMEQELANELLYREKLNNYFPVAVNRAMKENPNFASSDLLKINFNNLQESDHIQIAALLASPKNLCSQLFITPEQFWYYYLYCSPDAVATKPCHRSLQLLKLIQNLQGSAKSVRWKSSPSSY